MQDNLDDTVEVSQNLSGNLPGNLMTPRADVLAIPAAPALQHPVTSRPCTGTEDLRHRTCHLNLQDAGKTPLQPPFFVL
jgi:hypothetical protein